MIGSFTGAVASQRVTEACKGDLEFEKLSFGYNGFENRLTVK